MKIKELLNWGEDYAIKSGMETSGIKLLIQHFTKKEGYEIIRDMQETVSEDVQITFKEAVTKYCKENIPVQHIMGYETFVGHKIGVNEHVLIPRFETEELVYKILETYDDIFEGLKISAVDVGTGSGAIAISLALEEHNINMTATELCEKALETAKNNAKNLNAKVDFFQGDMLKPLIEKSLKFDILVSNPPYIPNSEEVDSFVKDNEPHLALFGGEDGLYFYNEILKNAHKILKEKNFIAFEHGYQHKDGIHKLIKKYYPNSKAQTFQDINGKDRITLIINN